MAVILLHLIEIMHQAIEFVRKERKPMLGACYCSFVGHHTSGVRKEFYRSKEDLETHALRDPYPKLRIHSCNNGISAKQKLINIEHEAKRCAQQAFEKAVAAVGTFAINSCMNMFLHQHQLKKKKEQGNLQMVKK